MNNNVMKIARINLRGNTMDQGWFKHLTLDNGKPYMVAITVLSEIFYWYKPTEIRDEKTNEIRYKQKFKADKLQKSYQQLADSFGFTKRQVLEACKYLLKRKLILIEFRTIIVNGTRLNNVMYVEPIVENIQKISILYQDPITLESDTLPHYNEGGSHTKKGEAPSLERGTNTENTTETTTKKKTSCQKFSTSDMENAKLLFELMLQNNPSAKEPNLEKWANDFRLMRERDNRTDEAIQYLINWTQKDDFWSTNILSPAKLRKQFDALVVKIKKEKGKNQSKTIKSKKEVREEDFDLD
ncbi:TPA: DNA replication protein DnaD [Bacillus cereus]|nr:DNA replication protein DnaD [Bacillus cereus]